MDFTNMSRQELYELRDSINDEIAIKNAKKQKEDYKNNLKYIGKCYKMPFKRDKSFLYIMIVAPMITNKYRFYTLSFEYPIFIEPSEDNDFNFNGIYLDDFGLLTFSHDPKNPFVQKIELYKEHEISEEEYYKTLDEYTNQIKKMLKDREFINALKE